MPQIKALTGHKSDTVVQGYIDRSKVQRDLVANAVSIQPKKRSATELDESHHETSKHCLAI